MRNFRTLLGQIILGMILLSFPFKMGAQSDTLTNLPNLLLPQFSKSVIKFKSGGTKTAMMNYDLVDQVMVMLQGKLTFILNEHQPIDTIYIENRKFVPFQNCYYELLVKGHVTLFNQHISHLESVGTPIGYGETSQYSPPSFVRSTTNSTNDPIRLNIPAGFKIVANLQYWIRKDNNMNGFNTKRQFKKIFPDKEKELNIFFDKNRIDISNVNDVIKLVNYCNGLYK
jgi:hypothetical protein